jgi:hypothetical protein
MKVGKLLVIAGLTYIIGSTARAVYEGLGTVVFLAGIAIILILVFGLFDWTYYDDVIRSALGLVGLVYFAWIVCALMAGQWGLAFLAVIVLAIVAEIFQPMVSGVLAWWDTPERRLEQRMEQACGYEYNYSPKDGYCHFDHENHEDLLTTDNPNGHGYVERKVPPNWNDSGPAEGALENIQWLKQAPEPHGFFASLAWVWWLGMPAIIWWVVKKLFAASHKPPTDPDVGRQISRYRRAGFRDPRQKEIERRMRDYLAGRTGKF